MNRTEVLLQGKPGHCSSLTLPGPSGRPSAVPKVWRAQASRRRGFCGPAGIRRARTPGSGSLRAHLLSISRGGPARAPSLRPPSLSRIGRSPLPRTPLLSRPRRPTPPAGARARLAPRLRPRRRPPDVARGRPQRVPQEPGARIGLEPREVPAPSSLRPIGGGGGAVAQAPEAGRLRGDVVSPRRVSSSCRSRRTDRRPRRAMAESDWDTVTVLRKKGPTAAQAKSKQVTGRLESGRAGRSGLWAEAGGYGRGPGAGALGTGAGGSATRDGDRDRNGGAGALGTGDKRWGLSEGRD
jgi:hypothetical protein